MNVSLPSSESSRHRAIREVRPRMAKVVLTDRENAGWLALGLIVARALSLAGWTIDQCARSCSPSRDRAQISRWIHGQERPQIDTLWMIEDLRQPLAQAIGEASAATVEVVVRMRVGGAR